VILTSSILSSLLTLTTLDVGEGSDRQLLTFERIKNFLTSASSTNDETCKSVILVVKDCIDAEAKPDEKNKQKSPFVCISCPNDTNECQVEFHTLTSTSVVSFKDILNSNEGGEDEDFSIQKYVNNFCSAQVKIGTSQSQNNLFLSEKKISQITLLEFSKDSNASQITVKEKEQLLEPIDIRSNSNEVTFTSIYSSNTIQFAQYDQDFVKEETQRAFDDTIKQYHRMHSLINAEQESETSSVLVTLDCNKVLNSGKEVLLQFMGKSNENTNGQVNNGSSNLQINLSCENQKDINIECSDDSTEPGKIKLTTKINNEKIEDQFFMRTSFYDIIAITNSYFDYLGNALKSHCKIRVE